MYWEVTLSLNADTVGDKQCSKLGLGVSAFLIKQLINEDL